MVTQGSIHPVARRNVIDDFVGSISDRFEDAFVLCAFTSPEVRTFLRQRDGEKMRDIRASLLHMQMEGVTDVTVISTHVYENEGYLSMREQVSSCANIFKFIRVARPLLEDETDLDLFARAATVHLQRIKKTVLWFSSCLGKRQEAMIFLKVWKIKCAPIWARTFLFPRFVVV